MRTSFLNTPYENLLLIRFCFRQVKGCTVCFRRYRNDKNNKRNDDRNMAFKYPPAIFLRLMISEIFKLPVAQR